MGKYVRCTRYEIEGHSIKKIISKLEQESMFIF